MSLRAVRGSEEPSLRVATSVEPGSRRGAEGDEAIPFGEPKEIASLALAMTQVSMKKLHLSIVTPERTVYEDEVDSVSVMTDMGEVTVLPDHIPLVANLRAGELTLRKNGEAQYLVASTGFLEVRPGNKLVVLADTAERAEELELEKIEEARERARQLLTQRRHVDDVAFANAAAMLERELARYKVASKHKRRK